MQQEFITEWKNISDDVRQITDFIVNEILKDVTHQKTVISNITYQSFITNNFQIHINQNNINQIINVKYVLYNAKSDDECKWIIDRLRPNMNCEWDEDTKTMTIVSVLTNGKPSNIFKESIVHEIEHMYQYFLGMNKNVNLYDKSVEMYKRGESDRISYRIGLGMYYSFKHEQDAYVQQFYQYLQKYQSYVDLDAALDKYQPFINVNNVYNMIYDLYDNKYAIKCINELGYSRKDYYKRIKFAYGRLIKKLENVYERWKYENKEKFLTSEGHTRRAINRLEAMIELNENKKIDTERNYFGIEFFYNIING